MRVTEESNLVLWDLKGKKDLVRKVRRSFPKDEKLALRSES